MLLDRGGREQLKTREVQNFGKKKYSYIVKQTYLKFWGHLRKNINSFSASHEENHKSRGQEKQLVLVWADKTNGATGSSEKVSGPRDIQNMTEKWWGAKRKARVWRAWEPGYAEYRLGRLATHGQKKPKCETQESWVCHRKTAMREELPTEGCQRWAVSEMIGWN